MLPSKKIHRVRTRNHHRNYDCCYSDICFSCILSFPLISIRLCMMYAKAEWQLLLPEGRGYFAVDDM